jgi:uncharacterized alpha-E superfamily protein
MGSCAYPSERSVAPLRAELDYTSVDNIIGQGLHEYLDGLQVRMNAIDDNLSRDFFAGQPIAKTQTQTQTQTVMMGGKS